MALGTWLCLAWCPPALAQGMEVTGDRDALSISASAAPVNRLAQRLSDATGIRFSIAGNPDSPVTIRMVDEPLVQAVTLLSPNHLLVRENDSSDATIVEVVLILDDVDSGAGTTDAFLPSGDPADDIPDGGDAYAEEAYADQQDDNPEQYDADGQPILDESPDPEFDPDANPEPPLQPAQPMGNEALMSTLPPPPDVQIDENGDIAPPPDQ